MLRKPEKDSTTNSCGKAKQGWVRTRHNKSICVWNCWKTDFTRRTKLTKKTGKNMAYRIGTVWMCCSGKHCEFGIITWHFNERCRLDNATVGTNTIPLGRRRFHFETHSLSCRICQLQTGCYYLRKWTWGKGTGWVAWSRKYRRHMTNADKGLWTELKITSKSEFRWWFERDDLLWFRRHD